MQTIKKLRKDITLTAVCNKGYNDRDMTSYYGGTFLLRAVDEEFDVVFCHGCLNGNISDLLCDVYDRDDNRNRIEIPVSQLYRFTPRLGYYLSGDEVISYNLPTTRSYKKGINRELLRISWLNDDYVESCQLQMQCLVDVCSEPELEERGDTFILSHRIAVHGGKVYSFYKDKTVGSYSDGVLTTPFASIIDRVNQFYGDIKCQLQTL